MTVDDDHLTFVTFWPELVKQRDIKAAASVTGGIDPVVTRGAIMACLPMCMARQA